MDAPTFAAGATLGWTCIGLSLVTVLLGAVGAAVWPAWKATKVEPLDAAVGSRLAVPGRRWSTKMSLIGLCLMGAAPMSVFVLPLPDDWLIWCYSFVTYPALLLGMVLLTPAIVMVTEKLGAPLLAALLRIDRRLLRTQLSTNLWRTVGATLALSAGLGLYASTQIWGYSMLQPFLPGEWMPDVLVAFQPKGLDAAAVEEIKRVDGVRDDELMPVAVEQAKLDWGDAPNRPNPGFDNVVVFGIDPSHAFAVEHPLLKVGFVDGAPSQVARQLEAGGTCIISTDFRRTSGKQVGDTLVLIPPAMPAKRVVYRIVGVVDLPGWQWLTKFSGVRRHFVRTSSMVFVDRDAVQRDFALRRPEFCWFNIQPEVSPDRLASEMQRIAETYCSGGAFIAEGFGRVESYRPVARVTTASTVKKAISLQADLVIGEMSRLPLIALFIMSLAVANAVIASVRVRQWELGILRAVGITRGQLVRLVVAEAWLIGGAACLLSVAFGLVAGWCGVGMARFGTFGKFSGELRFVVPWLKLGWGCSLALILCSLVAAWPAWRIGYGDPLTQLATGRGAR